MLTEKTRNHREIWKNKKILREVYHQWYKKIVASFSKCNGVVLEIGAGCGGFKEFFTAAYASDIQHCSWIDLCHDALALPFRSNTLSNIVIIDVLHHLPHPLLFFSEAIRALCPGGRVLIVEPYPSPLSRFVYKQFHPEPFIFDENLFDKKEYSKQDVWKANQATAFILLYRDKKKFLEYFSRSIKMMKQERMSSIAYPLSGGFEHPPIIPEPLFPCAFALEKLCKPLHVFAAFRCYCVLEKL
ncbi:MAG: methyltransferase domain-containing protein [Chitinivibrionales bacterium]|nr:methyltransferase domain-containing protein [Chitinivibrionales bacterium]